MLCCLQEDDLVEVEGRDDILVMVVSSVAVGWGALVMYQSSKCLINIVI